MRAGQGKGTGSAPAPKPAEPQDDVPRMTEQQKRSCQALMDLLPQSTLNEAYFMLLQTDWNVQDAANRSLDCAPRQPGGDAAQCCASPR